MTRSVRRIILAVVIAIVITAVGTAMGFFNISDLLNRVVISREDNEFGGKTTTKVCDEDKSVSWTRNYDSSWIKTIDNKKPYQLIEVLDGDKEVIEYTYIYFADSNLDTAVDYYKEALKDKEIDVVELEEFTSIEGSKDNYSVTIKIEPEDDQQVEVYFNMIQQ